MNWKKWTSLIFLLLAVGGVAFFGGTDLLFSTNIEVFYEKVHGGLIYVLLITLGLMIVQNLFTLFPILILVLLNQWLFDFWLGFFWSWIGTLIGSTCVFLFTKQWYPSLITHKRSQELFKKIRRHGMMAVFLARLIPIFPSNIINIASGLSGISFRHFFIGTLFGNLIFTFVLSLIGTGVVEEENDQYLYWGIALVILIMWISIVCWRKDFKIADGQEQDKSI